MREDREQERRLGDGRSFQIIAIKWLALFQKMLFEKCLIALYLYVSPNQTMHTFCYQHNNKERLGVEHARYRTSA